MAKGARGVYPVSAVLLREELEKAVLRGASARGLDADEQAVHLEVDYPENVEQDLNRWLPLVKWLLAIPHYVVLAFLWLAFVVLTVVAFFAILVTGRYPRGIFEFNLGTPSGLSNNVQILELLREADPEMFATVAGTGAGLVLIAAGLAAHTLRRRKGQRGIGCRPYHAWTALCSLQGRTRRIGQSQLRHCNPAGAALRATGRAG